MPQDSSHIEQAHQQAPQDTPQNVSMPAVAPSPPPAVKEKPPRTKGLWLLDTFLYGILANTSVFLMSVAATYLTSRGDMTNAEGKRVYGRIGKFFYDRGEVITGFFKKTGMGEESAKMSKMVFFSWFDGSLLAPLIKLAEDQRKPLAKRIDKALGTEPADDSVYDTEPKQSWGSVLGGRLATCAVVVPTAVLLDKKGLNEKWFYTYGKALGEKVEQIPMVAKHFGKHDIAEIGRVSLFEAFYTSVCTAGLYISSRMIAGLFGNKTDKNQSGGVEAARKDVSIVDHVLASPAPAGQPVPANVSVEQTAVPVSKPSERILLPHGGTSSERVTALPELAFNN